VVACLPGHRRLSRWVPPVCPRWELRLLVRARTADYRANLGPCQARCPLHWPKAALMVRPLARSLPILRELYQYVAQRQRSLRLQRDGLKSRRERLSIVVRTIIFLFNYAFLTGLVSSFQASKGLLAILKFQKPKLKSTTEIYNILIWCWEALRSIYTLHSLL